MQLAGRPALSQPQSVRDALVSEAVSAADADVGGRQSGEILRSGRRGEVGEPEPTGLRYCINGVALNMDTDEQ